MKGTKGDNCKLADDDTLWHNGQDLDCIRKKATGDIETIVEWTRKWRININMEKCEVCIFAKKDLDQHQKELVVNNYSFKYNPTPRLLGIILDEKIKFDNHIMHVERKANNAIHIIRAIKGLANISRTKLLRIYNSLVISIIEYGCPVWQITPTENMKKLDAIQRKGLSICLELPATSGREAMEVEGNILPVDLRIEEIAVREIAKIQSKNIAEPVKQQLEEYLSRDDIYEQQESPFGKAINQTVDMFKATKVDIKLIEPEVTYKAGVDVMMMRAPITCSPRFLCRLTALIILL